LPRRRFNSASRIEMSSPRRVVSCPGLVLKSADSRESELALLARSHADSSKIWVNMPPDAMGTVAVRFLVRMLQYTYCFVKIGVVRVLPQMTGGTASVTCRSPAGHSSLVELSRRSVFPPCGESFLHTCLAAECGDWSGRRSVHRSTSPRPGSGSPADHHR